MCKKFQSCSPSILQVLAGNKYIMLCSPSKSLSSSFLGLAGNGLSRCGIFRSFSSCFTHAARWSPTDEELSTMSPSRRWYYRKMEDPAYRDQECARNRPKTAIYRAKMRASTESPEYAHFLAVRRASSRKHYKETSESSSMARWLRSLSVDQREAFNWKTHLPVVYPERVRKSCSTCLASYMHGAKLW